MKHAAPLLSALALAGCAASPPPRAALPPPPADFIAAASEPVVARDAFLDSLGDPALDRLLAAARAGSPDLEAAAARIAQSRALLDSARAASRPDLAAQATVTQQRASVDQFGFALPPGIVIERERLLLNPALSASFEPDLFGRLAASRRAARERLAAATLDAAGVRLTLEGDVARAALAVRTIDLRLVAARESVAYAEQIERLARDRVQAGLVTARDAADAALLAAQARAAVQPLEADRAARVAALSTLTGLPVPLVTAAFGTARPLPDDRLLPDAGVPSELLARRPDVAAADARLRAADADLAAALRARYPRLTLTGSLGFLADTLARLFTGDAFTASLGGTLAAPLLDFGRTAAEAARARGASGEAAAFYRRAVLTAVADVDGQLAAARLLRARRADLAAAAQAAADAETLAASQYRGGLTSMADWLTARRAKLQARDAELAGQGAALDAAVLLWRAAGGEVSSRLNPPGSTPLKPS